MCVHCTLDYNSFMEFEKNFSFPIYKLLLVLKCREAFSFTNYTKWESLFHKKNSKLPVQVILVQSKIILTGQREETEASTESRKHCNSENITNENKTARARHYFSISVANVSQFTPKPHKQTQAVRHADKLMVGKGDIFCFKCDCYLSSLKVDMWRHVHPYRFV